MLMTVKQMAIILVSPHQRHGSVLNPCALPFHVHRLDGAVLGALVLHVLLNVLLKLVIHLGGGERGGGERGPREGKWTGEEQDKVR